jgi:hypothetical protein
MLLWIDGLSAALPDHCLRGAPSGVSAQQYCLPGLTFQAVTASTGLTEAEIRCKLLAAVAALSLKSP